MPETVLTLAALPLTSLPVVGVLDQEVSPTGVTYRRLPAWTRAQIVDLAQQLVLTMPAGGRLAFRTDSRVLELDVMPVGGIEEVVSVVAEGTSIVTTNANLGYTVDAQRIAELPLIHGDPYKIMG